MRKFSPVETRILRSLKEYSEAIDVESIMSATLLPRFAVEHALDSLEQEGMISRNRESLPITQMSGHCNEATCSRWLDDFLEEWPPVPGQNANGRHSGHALVILAALLTDSEDPDRIAGLLSLPFHYVMLTFVLAAAHKMWGSHQVLALHPAIEEGAGQSAQQRHNDGRRRAEQACAYCPRPCGAR